MVQSQMVPIEPKRQKVKSITIPYFNNLPTFVCSTPKIQSQQSQLSFGQLIHEEEYEIFEVSEKEEIEQSISESKTLEEPVQDQSKIRLEQQKQELDNLYSEIEQGLKDLQHWYDEQIYFKMEKSYENVDSLLYKLSHYEENLSNLITKTCSQIKKDNNFLLKMCLGHQKRWKIFQKLLNQSEGWVRDKKGKDRFNLEYNATEKGVFFMRMSLEESIDVEDMICLMREYKYYDKIQPFCSMGELLKEINKASLFLHIVFNVPIISDREVYVYAHGHDCIDEEGCFYQDLFSLDCDLCPDEIKEVMNFTAPKSKKIQALVRAMSFKFKMLGKNKVKIDMVMNIDQKLDFIPEGLIQWGTKKMSKDLLKSLITKSGKLQGKGG